MSSIQTVIETRVSTNQFDTERPVSSAQFNELVRLAVFWRPVPTTSKTGSSLRSHHRRQK